MIQGVLFDLDGTLIDSEPLWKEAEIALFKKQGLVISEEQSHYTMGLAPYQAVKYWHDKLEAPECSVQDLLDELIVQMGIMLREKGQLKPGVYDLLDFLKSKQLPMAIASGSPHVLIKASFERFGFEKYMEFFYSAEQEPHGKPHPGIFLTAADKLGVEPIHNLVFEDSFNGILAAKSARMKTVAYLEPDQFGLTRYDFADLKIDSLDQFREKEFEFLESLM